MRLGHVLDICLLCAGLVAGADQGTPPPSQQTPVFKSRIDIARVDVSIIDTKTGKAITGLTERDFTVIENGVRQTISTFAAESPTSTSTATRVPPRPVLDAAAPHQRRVFLIVLGGGRIQGPVNPHDGVVRFLRERTLPEDLISVAAFNRATAFTTDHEQLAQVVERLKRQSDDIVWEGYKESRKTEGSKADVGPLFQAAIDAAFAPPETTGLGIRNVTNMLLGTKEFHLNDGVWHPWNREIVFRDILKVYAGIEDLRHMDGEKHLVLLSMEGLRLPIKFANDPLGIKFDGVDENRLLAARANDAHVVLDVIHTFGSQTSPFNIMSSETIAELTGGQFTGLVTADTALGHIDDATRAGYVLGYVPTSSSLDGKYRNVEVKVNRRNVTILYAHGYTARADTPPIDLRDLITRERLRDAASADVAQRDIKVQAKATPITGAGGARQIRVDITIDASRLALAESGGTREGTIDLMILCGDAKQNVVGRLSQQMTLSLDAAHYQQAMTTGIPYVATVPVSAAVTHVKVLVYDYAVDLVGAVDVTVR